MTTITCKCGRKIEIENTESFTCECGRSYIHYYDIEEHMCVWEIVNDR